MPLTEGNVANVVAHGSIGVLQLQRRFPVAEEDLRGCVTGSAAFFELLNKASRKESDVRRTAASTTRLAPWGVPSVALQSGRQLRNTWHDVGQCHLLPTRSGLKKQRPRSP